MKRNLLLFATFMLFGCYLQAQNTLLYGTEVSSSDYYEFDTLALTITLKGQMTLNGVNIVGTNGLAHRPNTDEIYIIFRPAAGGRHLGTIDLETGEIDSIALLSDNIASISFVSENVLYGVTGENSPIPETLVTIDINTGVITSVVALGNGNDGEAIAFCPDNGKMYHWSGASTQVFESIDISGTPVVSNIPISGTTTSSEATAAVYIGNGEFMVNFRDNQLLRCDTLGNQSVHPVGTTTTYVKGLVFKPKEKVSGNLLAVELWPDNIVDFSVIDTSTYESVYDFTIDATGVFSNSASLHGMFWSDLDQKLYVVADSVFGLGKRNLYEIDPIAKTITPELTIGSGEYFANVTMSPDGRLFGITGYGSNTVPSETLCEIDRNTGAVTQLVTIPFVNAARTITFSKDDGNIYVLAGSYNIDTTYLVSIDTGTLATNTIYIPRAYTNIHAMNYIGDDIFMFNSIDFNFIYRMRTDGTMVDSTSYSPNIGGLSFFNIIDQSQLAFCANESMTLPSLYTGNKYTWYRDGVDLNENGSSINLNTAGNYTLKLETDEVLFCQESKITALNVPNVNLTASDTTFCAGDSVTLGGSNGGSSQWFLNGVAISGASTNSFEAFTEGVYNMLKTNMNGCSDSSSVGIFIEELALPSVSLSANDSSLCVGETATLTGTGGGTSQWYLNGLAISGASSSTFSADTEGFYNMVKTNTNGCADSASTGLFIEVFNALLPTGFLGSDTTICVDATLSLNAGISGLSYSWSTGGSAQAESLQGSVVGVGNTLNVSLTVTDGNNCSYTDAIDVSAEICSGIRNINQANIKLYPNPAKDFIQVDLSQLSGTIVLELYDILGKQRMQTEIANAVHVNLNISELSTGIYFIKIINGTNEATAKFTKK